MELRMFFDCSVAYMDESGCVHFCLPIYVDVGGVCHASLAGIRAFSGAMDEAVLERYGPVNLHEFYAIAQARLMLEREEQKRLMECVLEEMIQRVREMKRMKAKSKLQLLHKNNASIKQPNMKDLLLRELWDDHQGNHVSSFQAKREINSKHLAPTRLHTRCGMMPRCTKNRVHNLHQPRAAVY